MSLPGSIKANPQLARWLTFHDDGTITVRTGKVEIGQGIKTAIAIIAAEELSVSLSRIQVVTADTRVSPEEGFTSGSMSIQDSGGAVRVAAATAREVLLSRAAELFDVSADTLSIDNGVITAATTNQYTDYWQLAQGQALQMDITELPPLKAVDDYVLIGGSATRLDLTAKLKGDPAYVQDLNLPGLHHGRLVKPPTPDSTLAECPRDIDIEGVRIVRDGNFLGVVAQREAQAVLAAERLALQCRWLTPPISINPEGMPEFLKENVSQSQRVVDGAPVPGNTIAPPPPASAAHTLNAAFYKPYTCHASMAPSAAVAQFKADILTIHSHSQGIGPLRKSLSQVLGLPVEQIHIKHIEGAGCYGHNGADDVSLDAALLAMACAPDPVSVKWSRSDEFGFEPFAPAMLCEMQASLDDSGRVIDWRHEVYSPSHIGRPRPGKGGTNLQSAWWLAEPHQTLPRGIVPFPEVCAHRNLRPIYTFADSYLVEHLVDPGLFRTSSFRGLGALGNVFAIESFVDELAHIAQADPIEFRVNHLQDERAIALLHALRDFSPPLPTAPGSGRGIAMARYANTKAYCAVAVDVRVTEDAAVQLLDATLVADAGLVIDPDGLVNQLEGGFVQAASIALKEAVSWDHEGITSLDWETYPILRFSEVPAIRTHLISDVHNPSLGAGEASTGPTPPAIANAIFAATGIRIRQMPFTPESIRQAAAE